MSDIKPIVLIDVNDLKPYDKNAKIHDEEQVQRIANSIKRFGFRGSISITKDMEIINGHGRHLACKLLKLKRIPCVIEDDMTEEEIRAFRLADNKANEGGYDTNLLSQELMELSQLGEIDMSEFFSEKELNFALDEIGEIDLDGLTEDLKDEVEKISESTAELSKKADSDTHSLEKAFGFKQVSTPTLRKIKRLMALAEDQTGGKGETALQDYLSDHLGL